MNEFLSYILESPLFLIWVFLLQVLLCTRKKKGVGLILPILFLGHSIIFGMYLFSLGFIEEASQSTLQTIVIAQLIASIPGAVLLAMYFIFKRIYHIRKK